MNSGEAIQSGAYAALWGQLNAIAIRRFLTGPGMGFGDTLKWWAEGMRQSAHNGIDLLRYENTDGAEGMLHAGASVPVMADGRLVRVMPDYIAKTLVAEHGIIDICINNAIYWYPRRIPVCDQRVQPRFSQTAAAGRSSCWMRG